MPLTEEDKEGNEVGEDLDVVEDVGGLRPSACTGQADSGTGNHNKCS
jgi:hypothetical protein